MPPEVVFFDLGHTLISGADQSPRRLLGARLNLTEKETKRVGKLIMTHPAETPEHLSEALGTLLPRHSPEVVRRAVGATWEDQIRCVREIPGASETLVQLRRAGFRLGIISNIWHPFYLGFKNNCPELHAQLDFEFLSYREGIKKPAPELYRKALAAADTAADCCWMVGDSCELDMEPAAKIGIRTLWILCRPERERSLLVDLLCSVKPGPDRVVESIRQVAPAILNAA